MVVIGTLEIDERLFNRAYSNAGYLIRDAQGRYYADAVWPIDDPERTFAETRIPADSDDRKEVVRTWTPLALKRACGERWDEVKAALLQTGIFDEFVMAAEIREDDDAFKSGYAWAVQAYGQETVDAVLEAAEKGA